MNEHIHAKAETCFRCQNVDHDAGDCHEPKTCGCELCWGGPPDFHEVNQWGERSAPTKITDAHWIASGGMGDPTP